MNTISDDGSKVPIIVNTFAAALACHPKTLSILRRVEEGDVFVLRLQPQHVASSATACIIIISEKAHNLQTGNED